MNPLRNLSRVHASSLAGTIVGGLVYFAVLLDLRWAPGRTAHPLGYASNFFDIQARAIMGGRLDVPQGSLGLEGFELGDRTFMYFPPFPALIRIPVFWITDEFAGRLTVVSMAVGWLVFAIMATRMLWLVGRIVLQRPQPTVPEAVGAAVLIALVTGGTVVTFDASLPWVYHEVYIWAVASVVGSLYWLIRATQTPIPRNIAWLAGFALAAAWTRTTGGIAVIGAISLAAAWWWWEVGRNRTGARPLIQGHHLLGVAAALPLAGLVTVNMGKFNHPYMFPLEHQVWTTLSERRRQALEVNGGTITGPQFLQPTLENYFRVDGLRFTDYFPWVSLPAEPPPLDGVAFFDQTYRVASVTATTPLLLALLVVAAPLLLWRPPVWRCLFPALLGAVAVGLPVLMYGYIAYRYTSEFVPALVVGGILGYWLLAPHVLRLGRAVRSATLGLMALLTAYSLLVQTALGVSTSATTQGGEPLERFLSWQYALSGGEDSPQSRLILETETLPVTAPADTIALVDDCRTTYYATGDRYEPWASVDAESLVLEVKLRRGIRPGLVKIATIGSTVPRDVLVEVRQDHHVRILVRDPATTLEGNWFGVYPDTTFRIGIALRPGYELATVSSTPGGYVAQVPALVRDLDWFTSPGVIAPAPGRGSSWVGLSYREVEAVPSQLCRELAASATPAD